MVPTMIFQSWFDSQWQISIGLSMKDLWFWLFWALPKAVSGLRLQLTLSLHSSEAFPQVQYHYTCFPWCVLSRWGYDFLNSFPSNAQCSYWGCLICQDCLQLRHLDYLRQETDVFYWWGFSFLSLDYPSMLDNLCSDRCFCATLLLKFVRVLSVLIRLFDDWWLCLPF